MDTKNINIKVAVFDSTTYTKDEVVKMTNKDILRALKEDTDTACGYDLDEYEKYLNKQILFTTTCCGGTFNGCYIRFYSV